MGEFPSAVLKGNMSSIENEVHCEVSNIMNILLHKTEEKIGICVKEYFKSQLTSAVRDNGTYMTVQ